MEIMRCRSIEKWWVSTFYWLVHVEVLERVTRTKRSTVYLINNFWEFPIEVIRKPYPWQVETVIDILFMLIDSRWQAFSSLGAQTTQLISTWFSKKACARKHPREVCFQETAQHEEASLSDFCNKICWQLEAWNCTLMRRKGFLSCRQHQIFYLNKKST